MGNRIYGCDDCLAVCPWNKFATVAEPKVLKSRSELEAPHLADLVQLDDADFRTMFSGSPIKRIGRDRFVRNVLIAIGNSDNSDLAQHVAPLSTDESPLVRAMAIWALSRISLSQAVDKREAEMDQESDADVRREWAAF
jgi:epoxyqueuosine reductase